MIDFLQVAFAIVLFGLTTSDPLRGATPVQADFVEDTLLTFRYGNPPGYADDVDVIVLHDDFYGVPWNYFLDLDPVPPSVWLDYVQETQSLISADWRTTDGQRKPVLLALTMVAGGLGRSCPSRNATEQSGYLIQQDFSGCSGCFNFSDADPVVGFLRNAYVDYVLYLVDAFEPDYLNAAIELTLYRVTCDLELFEYVVDFSNQVYDAVKALYPNLPVFPSLMMDGLTSGDPCDGGDTIPSCVSKHLVELSLLKRDYFAISTYPYMKELQGTETFESDWFSRVFDQVLLENPSEKIAVAETGWFGTPILADVPPCTDFTSAITTTQSDYLTHLFQAANDYSMDFVVWFSHSDATPSAFVSSCPCSDGVSSGDYAQMWCDSLNDWRTIFAPNEWEGELMLKVFGSIGLREFDGTEREGPMAVWRENAPEEVGSGSDSRRGRLLGLLLLLVMMVV